MTNQEGKLDPSLVARLYLDHCDELHRFLIGLLRDHQLARDALQTVFTTLADKGHTAREETRKAWLFRVAYNEAMLIRRKAATSDRVLRRAVWSKEVLTESADHAVIRTEVVNEVRLALDELPVEQRRVVHMRMYEEKTFAEIAAELKIPLGTALGRMRTALEKLRNRLGEGPNDLGNKK